MKIVKVSAIPMSAPVPEEKRHRTDLGTKVKSDATLIRVETDNGLTGIGAALGTPPIVAAIVQHELAAECVDENPMFSERIYEKMYNGSRSRRCVFWSRRSSESHVTALHSPGPRTAVFGCLRTVEAKIRWRTV